MKILIVEDTPAIAKAYKLISESAGHHTQLAFTPSQAINLLDNNVFNLLFVDIMLPEISGIELVQRFRKRNITTPIIISTNLGSGYDAKLLKQLNIADIIMKATASPEDIRNLITKYAH